MSILKRILLLLIIAVSGWRCSDQKATPRLYPWIVAEAKYDFAKYVDPFIGTGGHGHTFPGATAPFGMVQLSPDTRLDGWDGCSGYHYSDSVIYGFSHTHLSGTGCSDYGDILLMPFTGTTHWNNGADGKPGYSALFRHDDEKAEAGYYAVNLRDRKVDVELTASPRVGFHKYSFDANAATGSVLIDLKHRDEVLDSKIEIVNDTVVRGYRFSKAWAADQRLYFSIHFSKPISAKTIAVDDKPLTGDSAHAKNVKAAFSFDLKDHQPVLVKVALSAVSAENAELNLLSEIPGWDFNAIRAKVKQAWNVELGRIEARGGSEEQEKTFYTALYHCCIAPNVYSDVDGSYRGRDMKTYRDTLHTQYTVFSLWDTYRALNPLFTIIQRDRTGNFINTFVHEYQQGGRLPVWELSANETDCMIGYHSVPVMTDAWIKGIRGFDTTLAYEAMRSSAMLDRSGLKEYRSYGYIPAEGESESVSKTLEYAYDDWCIAQIAQRMGKKDDYTKFISRAQSWQNLFDPKTQFMRARLNNAFVEPFAPAEVNFHYTEANAWQYGLSVPQDMNGLIQRMGGKAALGTWLDNLFNASSQTTGRDQADITGLIGQYAQGNEPSHHLAYLYCFADRPLDAQYRISEICHSMYAARPDGLCGNEDCGQMSAWYVMSAMGFYAVTPGTDQYVIGTPLFPDLTLHLENGKDFTITAPGVSTINCFVSTVALNKKVIQRGWLTQNDLMNGGTLEFSMMPMPTYKINLQPTAYEAPATSIPDVDRVPASPRIVNTTDRTFNTKAMALTLESAGNEIYCSVNNAPFEKTSTVRISETSTLRTFAKSPDGKASDTIRSVYTKIPAGRNIALSTEYAPQYAAGGDKALIDGLRGALNFRTGSWQGYEGVDLSAVVDLGKKQTISDSLSVGFLQDQGAWIFMPALVQFFGSDDGKTWTLIGAVANTVDEKYDGPVVKNFTVQKPSNLSARYIKVVGQSRKVCPDWHPGHGEKCWIFADEVIIQ